MPTLGMTEEGTVIVRVAEVVLMVAVPFLVTTVQVSVPLVEFGNAL